MRELKSSEYAFKSFAFSIEMVRESASYKEASVAAVGFFYWQTSLGKKTVNYGSKAILWKQFIMRP